MSDGERRWGAVVTCYLFVTNPSQQFSYFYFTVFLPCLAVPLGAGLVAYV